MLTLAIVLGSTIPGVIVACRVAVIAAWRFHRIESQSFYGRELSEPNGDQWFGATMLGLLAGCLWPAVLVIFALHGVLLKPPANILAMQQEKRIAELERELELR